MFVAVSCLTSVAGAASIDTVSFNKLIDTTIKVSLQKLEKNCKDQPETNQYPSYATNNLKWSRTAANGYDGWTSGFYPGCLWYAYALSKDDKFKNYAKSWTSSLQSQQNDTGTHDLGFIINCTFGNGIQFDPNVSADYKSIMHKSAKALDSRYNEKVGALRCYWDVSPFLSNTDLFPVVVDIMMNLELLMWSAANGGDAKLLEHSLSHARKTYKDCARQDSSSTYHVVRYKKSTGEVYNKGQLQGEDSLTTWTRGHAWVVYGMVTCYRFSKDTLYLNYARKLADYFLLNLTPDMIAVWDFGSKPDLANLKDASASAIVCAALFEMAQYMPDVKLKQYYYEIAIKMLEALCNPAYFSKNVNTNALLLHSTQYARHSTKKINNDKPAIFADYYFLEAIYRYKTLPKWLPTSVNYSNKIQIYQNKSTNNEYAYYSLNGKLIKNLKSVSPQNHINARKGSLLLIDQKKANHLVIIAK
jgi:unsaturated chondroitin disaccharide hydrolase